MLGAPDAKSLLPEIVEGTEVNWRSTRAPKFVEVDGTMSEDDIALIVDGNYVRAKTYSGKSADLEKLRQFLTDSGAKGVTIIAQPDTGVTRTASTVKAGASIEEVAAVLGHRDTATTHRVYARLYPEHLRAAVRRLERA